MVRRHPDQWPRRRYVTLLADLGIMTFFMHLGGAKVASFYPIILWVIIGNGIRFGERFLKVGIVAGSLGFGSLLMWDEYWSTHLATSAWGCSSASSSCRSSSWASCGGCARCPS